MAVSLSFIFGLCVLAYLGTFVVFAVVRILFGISIQRLWWSGLRRISFTPKEGVKVDIRGLRLQLHRPTFAQPTWLSVVITEAKVTIDLKTLGSKSQKRKRWSSWANGTASKGATPPPTPTKRIIEETEAETEADELEIEEPRSRTWKRLTLAKERIKKIHRKIEWLRLVDFVALSSSLVILEVGSYHLAHFTIAVDTRRKTVDRSRLFQHRKGEVDEHRPAEWILTARNLLFALEGEEANEILDHATLNVHGMLSQKLEGLRDASIAIKFGRVSLPLDDMVRFTERSANKRKHHNRRSSGRQSETSFREIMEELDRPGSQEEAIAQTVSDSKEFVSSILRGIHELQFAVGFVGLTKHLRTRSTTKAKVPIYINTSMKEVGLDVLRLERGSPAHLMYFSREDVAHQALLTAISISVGIDDGHEHPERLFYVPMATATIKSTLPSKTIQTAKPKNVADRNTNILFANLVVTSPSLDLDPKHLPLLLSFVRSRRNGPRPQSPPHQPQRHRLISRLLPKANVKITVHEPVSRVSLPCMDVARRGKGEFDLLISAMSSMSLDLDSSHSAGAEFHYSLSSTYRVNSHQLYYQTAAGEQHNLLITESLELKAQISASPEVAVAVSGNLQTFSVYMVRPEIGEGVRQIVSQLKADILRPSASQPDRPTVIRRLPPWLLHMQLTGRDFNVEVAGVDEKISEHARGIALHLESWTAEYKANRHEEAVTRPTRNRATSRSLTGDDVLLRPLTPSSPRKNYYSNTDHRRLAIHAYGLEGFVIEMSDMLEPESFVTLPRFEVALSTSTDQQGPILHVNSMAKALYVQYSLPRHFAGAMALTVLRKTFTSSEHVSGTPTVQVSPSPLDADPFTSPRSSVQREAVTIDFKAALIQIKAAMPADPNLMVQIFGLEAGRHRWSTPFAKSKLTRLYAATPKLRGFWSRIVSLRGIRLDYRRIKRRFGTGYVDERSVDVVSEAIRVGVPHQLVVHRIFDNITNVIKTMEQLRHRFVTGTEEDILEKKPEGPKKVPKVTLRTSAFLFEIEDGAFDWKLGTIYLNGLQEQRQRLAREEAFQIKCRKIEEADRNGSSKLRTKSAHAGRGRHSRRASQEIDPLERSKSADTARMESRRGSSVSKESRRLRYDLHGACGISDTAKRSIEEARKSLDRYNAQNWKRRIDHAYRFQDHTIRDLRHLVWGLDDAPEDIEQKEKIMAISQRPSLMAVLISDLNITIDKPSFPLDDYPNFLHKLGKGMPLDMQYGLLIPMHIKIAMGEARVTLRDYPLPVLHVPAIRPGQSPRLSSLSLETDFIIAEEYRDNESIRHVKVLVVPAERDAEGHRGGGLTFDVRRTVSAVKTYSDILIHVNTSLPTRITWGTSYQPAIQDMMQVIENFTKPPVDPSERVGFWDKIRLTFHSRIQVAWKGDGDVHLVLKGSRDPYNVTGSGAGFVMCWRNDVVWRLAQDDDPRKFMTVDSGEYVLAVPDFSRYARRAYEATRSDDRSIASTGTASSYADSAKFKKTIMKLSGNVQWLAGLVFERNTHDGGRSFQFKPHYEVALKSPEYAKSVNGRAWDAYDGFRSQHIHLSVAISAPHNRDWTVTNLKPSSNYNSVHLTPRFFSHFFDWWSMFSGVMSLPIRQGKLFPGIEKSSKKFARHLATIKYNLLLSPLYLSHMYKHKDSEEYGQNFCFATGLKLKIDSFMLDLHQRREELVRQVTQPSSKNKGQEQKTTAMRINQAQVDFISTDIRAISARIAGTNVEDIERADDEMLAGFEQGVPKADLSCFNIPDNDTGWVDMDDFVEMDWILPAEANPETKILPLAFAPRFTYFRNTDHHEVGVSRSNTHSSSHFGNEPTHFCVMSRRNDPRRVQCDLIQDRLDKLDEQIQQNTRIIGDQELKIIRSVGDRADMEAKLEAWKEHHETLIKKQRFLQGMHRAMLARLDDNDRRAATDQEDEQPDAYYDTHEHYDSGDLGMESANASEDISDFNNRFIIHNAQLKWNNSLRDIILRYIHQVSQRRGFVYYMSQRAVKFILDIVDEQQNKAKAPTSPGLQRTKTGDSSNRLTPQITKDDDVEVQDRIADLLRDAQRIVSAEDRVADTDKNSSVPGGPDDEISRDFTAQNAYHVRLIAPQIQLQSEKNMKSAVLVTSKGMQLKVVQIMDKDRLTDDISGLVQRRFAAGMDSVQIFVTSSKSFSQEFLRMYSGNRYGARAGSLWPPWVPLEVMFDFDVDPYGFQRVVERTSARMRFDKFNTLRLKYNDDVTSGQGSHSQNQDEARIDHIWVNFPQLHAICDSTQYYALYIMALDLLLYSEPLEKTRNEKLEKIMLASDFSDLSDAPAMVMRLQEKIRTMQEIKLQFQVNEQHLNRRQWKERIILEHDLAGCEEELFFIMKAITTSQRRVDERSLTNQQTGLLRWEIVAREVVWHLLRGQQEHLLELQLRNAAFNRIDNNDGSNDNTMEIGGILGYNLLDDALYPQMIAPFDETQGNDKALTSSQELSPQHKRKNLLTVHWLQLEAIAGIKVVERFEADIHPLRIQLERDVGMKVFEYIFPGAASSDGEHGFSPFNIKQMLPISQGDGDEDEDEEEDSVAEESMGSLSSLFNSSASNLRANDDLTGQGDLSLRLAPTMALPDNRRLRTLDRPKPSEGHMEQWRSRHFKKDGSLTDLRRLAMRAKDRTTTEGLLRPSAMRTDTNLSTMSSAASAEKELDLRKRFGKSRRASENSSKAANKKKQKPSDELNIMLKRANEYMALGYIRIPSMVLCLSYRTGKGHRTVIPDVHDLVFRLPTLEYRNKTWSTMDLVNQLKREVTKSLLGHAGAIVGNVFHSHKIAKRQQGRLRDLANSSVLLGRRLDHNINGSSETASSSRNLSILDSDAAGDDDYDDNDGQWRPRPSTADSSFYADSSQSIAETSDTQPRSGSRTALRTPPHIRRPGTGSSSAEYHSPRPPTDRDSQNGVLGPGLSPPPHQAIAAARSERESSIAESSRSARSRKSTVLGKTIGVLADKVRGR